MLLIGDNELGKPAGKIAQCPKCGGFHRIEYGIDPSTGEESKMLGFVKCGGKSWLVVVGGRLIP